MRSAPLRRPLAVITGLWFLVLMLEPVPLHTCAMHGGAMHGGAMHGGAMHGGAMHGGAMHGASTAAPVAGHHHHAAAAAPSQKSPPLHSTACTCLGACAGGVAVQLPTSPELAWVSVAWHEVPPPRAPSQCGADVRPGLRLPFANAPPASSLS